MTMVVIAVHTRASRCADTDYTDIGKLQSSQIKRGVEVAVELVVLAQRNFHDAMQLVDVGHIHDEIDVAEEGGVRIHRAHRRRDQNKKDAASLRRTENVDLSNNKRRSLFRRIKLRL